MFGLQKLQKDKNLNLSKASNKTLTEAKKNQENRFPHQGLIYVGDYKGGYFYCPEFWLFVQFFPEDFISRLTNDTPAVFVTRMTQISLAGAYVQSKDRLVRTAGRKNFFYDQLMKTWKAVCANDKAYAGIDAKNWDDVLVKKQAESLVYTKSPMKTTGGEGAINDRMTSIDKANKFLTASSKEVKTANELFLVQDIDGEDEELVKNF